MSNLISSVFFEEIFIPPFFSPVFGDIDLDGDLDLILAESKGSIFCFLNDNGKFSSFINPGDKEVIEGDLDPMDFSEFANVRFPNLDEDCEKEMVFFGFLGDDKLVQVFDAQDSTYVRNEAMDSMFQNIDLEHSHVPFFFDLSGDGIDELILFSTKEPIGNSIFIPTRYFQKVDGVYEEQFAGDNPLDSLSFECTDCGTIIDEVLIAFPYVSFGDLDGDGMLNLYLGFKGDIRFRQESDPGGTLHERLLCLETDIPVDSGTSCTILGSSGFTTQNILTFGDPCSCADLRNCFDGPQVYLHDTLVIPAGGTLPSGLVLRITASNDFYIDVPCFGGSLTTPDLGNLSGTQIPESPMGSGEYKIEFWQQPNIPTVVSVSVDEGLSKSSNSSLLGNDCICTEIKIPTLNQWAIYILGLCMLIMGTVGLSSRRKIINRLTERQQ